MEKKATVIASTRNSSSVIVEQLKALANQTVLKELELIVVDDASVDATAEIVEFWTKTEGVPITIIRRNKRGGPNASRNVGIRNSTTRIILLCDGDDVVSESWAEHLITGLNSATHEKILLSGRCVDLTPDNRLSLTTSIEEAFIGGRQYMLGGNGAFFRDAVIQIGGFDESILSGGTEVEFSLRALQSGFEVKYQPGAVVGYRQPLTGRGRFLRELKRSRGRIYLGKRFGPELGYSGIQNLFLNPLKFSVKTTFAFFVGKSTRGAVLESFGRLIGYLFWGFVFRLNPPQPNLGFKSEATF